MAKNLGTFTFAANFQVKAAEALDPRMVAASKADLINKANWPSDGDTIYVYKGLIVDCGEDGVYRLIDPAKALNTDYSGWERIDAGGVKIDNIFTYKGNKVTFEVLPTVNDIGDVYNVESSFTLEGKTYPAGTNVAWNGEGWDPLAGSVDLSAYATKTEVSEIRTNVATNAESISGLSTALGATNAEVAKKVDAEDGKSLISEEKLALIDTNAGAIANLQPLVGRVSSLEELFKDSEGGEINLSGINTTLGDHNSRLTALENDHVTRQEYTDLSGQVNGYGSRLQAVEGVNAEQATALSSLGQRLTTVEGYGATITELTGTVNGHTTTIGAIQQQINGLAVKSVSAEEKVLAADANGVLSTTMNLTSSKVDGKTYIQLTGINGALVSQFDASEFVKDGMIDSVVYDSATNKITITWNTDAGKQPTVIDMAGLVDTYTAGSGLTLVDGAFAVNVNASNNNRLSIVDGGLMVDLTDDIKALEGTMDDKIAAAFAWVDVK